MPGHKPNRSTERLFVALDLPDEVRRAAAGWGRAVVRSSGEMRVVPAGNIHITLAFLGNRPPSDLPLIADALADSINGEAGVAPALSLGAPVWLPRRRPRALALEIHDETGRLNQLQSEIVRALGSATGWQPRRSFRPHLTAVRLGRKARAEDVDLPVTPANEFAAEAVGLYRSRLTPEGAEYDALVTLPLTPA